MNALSLVLLLAAQDAGILELRVVEKDGGDPVPSRVHLFDAKGKAVQPPGLPFWRDHFVFEGKARLSLAPGAYRYEIERGPEYGSESGEVEIAAGTELRKSVRIRRLADLASEGWWSGELHVHRPLEHVELLMRAEDLHSAPVITWWNAKNLWKGKELPAGPRVFDGTRAYHVLAGEDEREGGALLFCDLPAPLDITGAGREYPSPMKFLAEARKHPGVHVDIEKPFWWDVPLWLASGQVDTIGLANNHMCRSIMYESEAWGKPRDAKRLPPPLGNGIWTQELYARILDCGIRIPPSAGSASGVLSNPVGYNRAYVQLDGPFSYEKWMEGLRAGRTFVTNGPLLRVSANGKWPGAAFSDEKEVALDLRIALAGRGPLEPVEILRDGRVERTLSVEEAQKTGSLGTLTFRSSGWFLVRCRVRNDQTFRFASTAPFYVEIGAAKKRISRSAVQFFLDWVEERMARVKMEPGEQRDEVLSYHLKAREFWRDLLQKANQD